MRGKRALPAFVFVAAASAGCHGPPIQEVGGTGTGGTTGTGGAGRGGGSGAGGAGPGGAGCAAQMQPVMFHSTTGAATSISGAPIPSQATSNRIYWVESGTPNYTIHYSPGAAPASDNLHPLAIGESMADFISVDVSDALLAATWDVYGNIAVYGPDKTSTQMGATLQLASSSAVAVDGTTVFVAYFVRSDTTQSGIYTWAPPAAPALFETYTDLGGDFEYGKLIRATPNWLLLSDLTNVWIADRLSKKAAQPLFQNPASNPVLDVRPARPRSMQQGVLVDLQDASFAGSGRDYYVDLTTPIAAPVDLASATNALADASACGAAAHYHGAGVLYQRTYIYEGQSGLFAVDVTPAGAVSNLVRLTTLPLGHPEVTGAGDLFAIRSVNAGDSWDYYRVGNL